MDDGRRYLEEYMSTLERVNHATAETSVWWDVKLCEPPAGCVPLLIGPNIRSWLARMGYRGDVTIFAFGDLRKIPNSLLHHSTGITFRHIDDGYESRRLVISAAMLHWATAERTRRNCLLISSDGSSLSPTLDGVRFYGHHIILEYPPNGSQAERECLLRGILGGELQSCLGALGNQKRRQGSSSSAPSSGNQKVAGKVGRSSISSAPPAGNQKVAGKVGRPSISSAPPSGNQEVAGKVGRPSISCAPSTGNRKVAGKVGRPSISSAPPSGNQEVAGN